MHVINIYCYVYVKTTCEKQILPEGDPLHSRDFLLNPTLGTNHTQTLKITERFFIKQEREVKVSAF